MSSRPASALALVVVSPLPSSPFDREASGTRLRRYLEFEPVPPRFRASTDHPKICSSSICYNDINTLFAGSSMSSGRYVLLVPVLALGVATPSLVLSRPAACLAAAELVGTPDFDASPRHDESAELLALSYTDGLVTDGTLYERIHQDLGKAALLLPISTSGRFTGEASNLLTTCSSGSSTAQPEMPPRTARTKPSTA